MIEFILTTPIVDLINCEVLKWFYFLTTILLTILLLYKIFYESKIQHE